MYSSTIVALLVTMTVVAACPANYATPPGVPNPSTSQLASSEKTAGGTLPNGPLPTSLKKSAISTLQLIALNELFEVAFFTDLLANVAKGIPGYDTGAIAPLDKDYLIQSLTAILEQEKLHSLGANAILKNSNQKPLGSCQYRFPVINFNQAILFAQAFTDIGLGTLPLAQAGFAADGGDETNLVSLIGSILAQEGEQNGFYRYIQKKKPSAAPFLTGGSPSFAFSFLQLFIVPSSCPTPLKDIDVPTFGRLELVSKPEAKNMKLEFAVAGDVDAKHNSIVYLSGQNLPVTRPVSGPTHVGDMTHFTADFPFESSFADGLTIAALVNGTGDFKTNDAVAAATVYGPGVIEIN